MKSYLSVKFSKQLFFAIFIVCCSGLWMTAITPLSPFYFCIFPILFYPFYLNYKVPARNYSTILTYFVCFSFSIYLIFQPIVAESTLHNNFVMAFCMFFYVFVDSILYSIDSKEDFKKILISFCVVTVFYMIIDFFKRYNAADFDNVPTWIQANPIFMFYLIKEDGVYGDSNATAVIALTALSLLYYFKKVVLREKKKYRFLYITLIISLFLTCSRSAIISFIFLVFFYHFFFKQNIYFKFFDMMVFFGLFILLIYFLLIDPSGKTKIDIFQKTWAYFLDESDMLKFLFGYGGNNSIVVLKLYAHNPISVYLIEYGLIGLSFYFLLYVLFFIDGGYLSLFVLLPIILSSLSFSPLHTTYVFAALSLIKQSKRIYKILY